MKTSLMECPEFVVVVVVVMGVVVGVVVSVVAVGVADNTSGQWFVMFSGLPPNFPGVHDEQLDNCVCGLCIYVCQANTEASSNYSGFSF